MSLVVNGILAPMECSDITIKCNLCAQNFKDTDERAQHSNDIHCGECSHCHYCKNMFAYSKRKINKHLTYCKLVSVSAPTPNLDISNLSKFSNNGLIKELKARMIRCDKQEEHKVLVSRLREVILEERNKMSVVQEKEEFNFDHNNIGNIPIKNEIKQEIKTELM